MHPRGIFGGGVSNSKKHNLFVPGLVMCEGPTWTDSSAGVITLLYVWENCLPKARTRVIFGGGSWTASLCIWITLMHLPWCSANRAHSLGPMAIKESFYPMGGWGACQWARVWNYQPHCTRQQTIFVGSLCCAMTQAQCATTGIGVNNQPCLYRLDLWKLSMI